VLYEIPLMAMGLAGHVLVVRSVPALSALPGPAQVGLAVLPTALIAANGCRPGWSACTASWRARCTWG
jgi:hypothetical protein